jgi:hypothetical protein
MATHVIHQDQHDYTLGPRWRVEQDWAMAGRPDLVRFVKRNQMSKRLDQIARWTPEGWDQTRWVPKHPQVPNTLLAIVENHMRGAQP